MMKKIYLLGLALAISLIYSQAHAQTAKVQWINNSAAAQLDSVDIYVDGVKVCDDLLYTSASAILTHNSGAHEVNINHYMSADSGDLVISRHSVTLNVNSNNTIMITGVDTPSNYAANPTGRDISIKLVHRKGVVLGTSNSANCAVSFINGVTDAAGFNLATRPTGIILVASKVKYSDSTGNMFPNAVEAFIDIRDTNGVNVLKSYILPLNLVPKRAITLFTSGFMDPSMNMNGAAMKVFYTDTTGGMAVELKEASRIQFIHASGDITLDSVDIWINSTKVASKLPYSRATTTFTVLSGIHDVTLAKKGSNDTSASNTILKLSNVNFVGGKTYVAIVSGVVDTTMYKTNPDGISRSLNIGFYDNYGENSGNSGQTRLFFSHNVGDYNTLTLSRNPAAPVVMYSNVAYNNTPSAISIAASNSPHIITESVNGVAQITLRLPLAGQGGKYGVLYYTGFGSSAGNPVGAKSAKYMVAFHDGTVAELIPLTGKLQMIHSSADISAKRLTLFLNGEVWKDTFSFRHSTPATPLIAYKWYRIHVSPLGSTDTSSALLSFSLQPDSGKLYYGIVAGLINTAGYAVNPNGVDRSFAVSLYANGREKAALNTKNVDLLYFHSVTDAPATESRGIGQILYLSKGDVYKAYHGYNAHSAFDNMRFDVLDDVADTIIHTCLANLTEKKGMAGIVISTGFLHPANNQNGDSLLLFAFWPNGEADTLPKWKSDMSGLSDLISDASVAIYPNPAIDHVELTFHSKTSSTATYMVTDITGRIIAQWNEAVTTGKNLVKINTAEWVQGTYLITIRSGDEQLTRKLSIVK